MKAGMLLIFFVAVIFLQQNVVYGFNGNRIVNGTPTPDGMIEFLPRLTIMFDGYGLNKMENEICSSTIISKRHILTAAHCVLIPIPIRTSRMFCSETILAQYRPKEKVVEVPGAFQAKKFQLNLNNYALQTKIYFHPSWYSTQQFEYDMAFIEFPDGTDLGVTPVKLAADYVDNENENAIAAGYGIYKWTGQINPKTGLEIPETPEQNREKNYTDNQDCIELFEQQGQGLLDLLEEKTRDASSSSLDFTKAVFNVHRNDCLDARDDDDIDKGFVVKHYAGAVCYQTAQFMEKNKIEDALIFSLVLIILLKSAGIYYYFRLMNCEFSSSSAPKQSPGNSASNIPKLPADYDQELEARNFQVKGRKQLNVTFGESAIKGYDLYTLRTNQYVNDTINDKYLKMVAKRSIEDPIHYRKSYSFGTFFYTMLNNGQDLDKLVSWVKDDLFDFELLFLPINQENHWFLFVVDMTVRNYYIYDSLYYGDYTSVIKQLLKFFKHYSIRKNHEIDRDGWASCPTDEQIGPTQSNGVDCGVFLCQYAEHLSRNAKLDFSQSGMVNYRKIMLYELMRGELIPKFADST